MGKKINPKIFRIKQTRTWDSRWFAVKNYSNLLKQDVQIKAYLNKTLQNAFIARIEIEKTAKEIHIIIFSARPGIIIGKGGMGVDKIKKEIFRKFIKDQKISINISIKEVDNAALDATLVAQNIKFDIEKRIPFRRALKQAISKVERAGAKGVKVKIGGRLNGAEIARSEQLSSGKIPLHTIRADIDYALVEANTMYGKIGIKVWIYRGDVFNKK
ncbi:30S ribosomal protein S3 [Patescibacteria group bacterium]|nr:30S ribosomal protein S3 [Patescibacteria group bacterium]